MRPNVLEHLMSRPIASIVENSKERCNEIALKLMCIVDYRLEKLKLYPEMEAISKLTEQLLKFHSFGSFNYFNYKMPYNMFGTKVLKCKNCELTVFANANQSQHSLQCKTVYVV